jgi:leucyl/phenylalanyl-tRNA--protein transferase
VVIFYVKFSDFKKILNVSHLTFKLSMIDPNFILQGYSRGIFPMADSRDGEIKWYSADPRGIIDLNDYHISKRLLRYIRNTQYEVRIDSMFEQVMRECANRPSHEQTWISEEMVESYVNLHQLGYAHSVEILMDGKLVGGLYGVSLKGAFFGESMFNKISNASKLALYHLIQRLIKRNYRLLDIQMITPTTAQFGAKVVMRDEYLRLLRNALSVDCRFI